MPRARKSHHRKVVAPVTRTSLQDIIRFFLTAPPTDAVVAQEVITEIVAYRVAEMPRVDYTPPQTTNGHDDAPLVASAAAETPVPAEPKRRPGRPRKETLRDVPLPLPAQGNYEDEVVSES